MRWWQVMDKACLFRAHQAFDIAIYYIYNKNMSLEWDTDKNARNIRERGIAFEIAVDFEWPTALVLEDTRRDYGERRFRAMGAISQRLYVLVFTLRNDTIRVISLRRANKREEAAYEKTQQTPSI